MLYIIILCHIKIMKKKNEPDSKYKKVAQRASSVFYQKRPISKSSLEKNKNEGSNKNNNRLLYKK